MATVNLGRIKPMPRGDYSSEVIYNELDIVTYNGESFICKGTTIGNLPTNPSFWQGLTSKGDTGDIGPQGLQGEIGPQGPKGDKGDPGEVTQAELDAVTSQLADIANLMGFKPMGAYNPANENKYGEWYTHDGGSYAYINPTPSTGVPLTDTTHWQQIASVGGQDILDAVTAEKNAAIAAKVLAEGYAAQLAAGTASPAGTYANLAALNSGTPTAPNVAKIYITINDGNWCYYNGSAWVAGGVYQATERPLDTTLSVSGMAADAKVTGDKVGELKIAITQNATIANNGNHVIVKADLESGSLSNGIPVESTSKIRTADFIRVVKGDEITWEAGTNAKNAYLYFYDLSKTYITDSALVLQNTECQIVAVESDGYIKVRFDTSSVDNYDSTFSVISAIKRLADEALETAQQDHDDLLIFANGNSIVKYGYAPVSVAFEVGNINLSNGSLVYSDNPARVRTPQSNTPHMKAGTVIGLDSYTNLTYVLYLYNGSTYTDTGWMTTAYTLTADADVGIVIKNATERNIQGNIDVLAGHFFAYEPSELLEKMESSINEYGLPNYWINYLNGKKDSLISADAAVGKYGLQFAFVTDEHLEVNAGHSPAILKWLMNNTALRQAVNGGDLLIKNDTKAEALRLLNKWGTETRYLPCINIIGNHDVNTTANSDHPEAHLTRDDIYQTLFGINENIETYTFGHGGINGYQDFPRQKIRIIYCDVGAYSAIDSFFTSPPSGWAIIVVTHIYWKTSGGTISVATEGQNLLDKIVSLIPSMNATIACLICGHTHIDYSDASGYGFPIIATTCDACGVGQPIDYTPRTTGTTAEQAIDLYYINTTDKTITVKRIGAGDTGTDRTFTYTETTVT